VRHITTTEMLEVKRACIVIAVLIVVTGMRATAVAETNCAETPSTAHLRESADDAWWTGPMLTPSANTLPRGHFLLEPYLYNVRAANSSSVGSLTYVLYGVTDRLTVGVIPTAGYNFVNRESSSSRIRIGDLSLQAQYRLIRSRPDSRKPTLSVNVQETLPTGRYDRLGNRSADGQGSGTHVTTLGIYTQKYFWLPNERILRARLNVSHAFTSSAPIHGTSVYGTGPDFRGSINRSQSPFVNLSGEYSLTRKWVIALDAAYRHDGALALNGSNTGVNGVSTNVRRTLSSHDSVAFAPAIEYSWRSSIGVLLGARVLGVGHKSSPSVTPAVAINYVR